MHTLKKMLATLGELLVVAIGVAAWVLLSWWQALVLAALVVVWMALARGGRRTASVTRVGLSTLPQRLGSSSVVVIGIAGVVAVLVALLSMANGYQHTLQSTGSNDTAIVMRGGSASETMSVLSRAAILTVEEAPGIARDAQGKPLASPELVVAARLPVGGAGSDAMAGASLRGIGPEAWKVRPNVHMVAGRHFKTGMRELIAGVGAARKFGLHVGQSVKLGSQTWQVVGIFKAGNALDSELWADAATVASTYRRASTRNAVIVRLTRPEAFARFKAMLASQPSLAVSVQTTRAYYSQQAKGVTKMLRVVGITVGSIMAIGALFGALNCMFATVASRAREIATLRAIGFRGVPVVVAVMLETLLLALLGGVLGGLIAWLVFNGYTASTIAGGASGLGQLSFQLRVSGELFWNGLKWALAIGFVGGLFPAVRAARLPVTTALRQS
ncbi:MAG TPA: ABC transporter permease [Rhodanobacteraceae bacterium]